MDSSERKWRRPQYPIRFRNLEQRESWEAAAERSGRTLANWIRFHCNLAARFEDRDPETERIAAEVRSHERQAVLVLLDAEAQKAREQGSAEAVAALALCAKIIRKSRHHDTTSPSTMSSKD